MLFRPAESGDSPKSPMITLFGGGQPTPEDRLRSRVQVAMAWTDDAGAFRFGGLDPGPYVVRALVTNGTETEKAIRVEAGRDAKARLALPPAAKITGRLIGPEGATFEKFALGLETEAAPGTWSSSYSRLVERDGRFRIGPIAAARVRVFLHFGNHTNPHRVLEELALVAGSDVAREYDVRPLWPGTVEVRATRDGQPLTDFTAWLHEEGKPSYTGYQDRGNRDGLARVGQVLAGRYRVTIADRTQRAWSSTTSEVVELAPGGAAQCSVALRLVERELQLLDAKTKEPLAATKVTLLQAEPLQRQGSEWTTDAAGRLRLVLPAGEGYYLRRTADVWKVVFDPARNLVSYDAIESHLRGQPPDFVWGDVALVLVR
jgi:hypothetical protein